MGKLKTPALKTKPRRDWLCKAVMRPHVLGKGWESTQNSFLGSISRSAPHQRVITWSPVIRKGSGNEEGRADSTSLWGRRIEGRAPQHSTTFRGTAMLVQAGPEGHFGWEKLEASEGAHFLWSRPWRLT